MSRRRRASSLPSLREEEARSEWMKNTLSIVGVCVVGAAGWAIAWKTGVWVPTPTADEVPGTETPLGASILGYASAVCYLGARIPQIIKNQRDQSCEGLSLLFFMLSLLGNATYGAGVSLSKSKGIAEVLIHLDHLPLSRKRVHPYQPSLAHRFSRYYRRGHDHIHTISHFRGWGADLGR
jgi:hypothetical protein